MTVRCGVKRRGKGYGVRVKREWAAGGGEGEKRGGEGGWKGDEPFVSAHATSKPVL